MKVRWYVVAVVVAFAIGFGDRAYHHRHDLELIKAGYDIGEQVGACDVFAADVKARADSDWAQSAKVKSLVDGCTKFEAQIGPVKSGTPVHP